MRAAAGVSGFFRSNFRLRGISGTCGSSVIANGSMPIFERCRTR